MIYPKMIIFDYGNTLLYEPTFDTLRGEEAVFEHVTVSKKGITAAQADAFAQELYAKIGLARGLGLELHELQYQKLLYESLGIELSITYQEAERIFWDNAFGCAVMPGAEKMIDYVNSSGIRSAVISNIGFSGQALTERLTRHLPGNRFEFVIASSEYGLRKPDPLLFTLALTKAGLKPKDVWFCGDNIKADVEGSAGAGIFPVWYEEKSVDNPWIRENEGLEPNCEHLHIHRWEQLIETLDKLKAAPS